MKKLIISFVLLLVAISAYTQVTVDGNAYLELQTVHDSVRIVFQRTAPSNLYDTVYSNNAGYFTINIPTGIYNVTYSKTGYLNVLLTGKSFYANTTLADTTLEAAGLSGSLTDTLYAGTYKVSGNVQVATGDTLVIEPGVKLLFKQGVQFDVNGLLIAEGNLNDSIIFTAYNKTSKWNGIKINSSVDDNSVISFALVEYSKASGMKINSASPLLNHLLIKNNTSSYDGAGIYMSNSDVVLDNVIINNNTCGSAAGAGIYCYKGNITILNSEIKKNTSLFEGGGISCWEVDNLNIINTKISSNKVMDNDGGGIFALVRDNITFSNIELTDNIATGGHGVSFEGMDDDTVSINLTNVTINNNRAITNGDSEYGIALRGKYYFHMTNSIISGHNWLGVYVMDNPLVVNINQCNFFGNRPSNFNSLLGKLVTTNANGDSCDAYNNIKLDPLFVNSTTGDYRLRKGSPCIDAGVNDSVTVSTDLYGNERIFDGDNDGDTIVDIGAYEADTNVYDITIASHPLTQTKCEGDSVALIVSAIGNTPKSYQWRKNSVNISNATDSIYTINNISISDAGNYDCIVSNNDTSNTATLTINSLPNITTQPTDKTKCVGQNVTFNVSSTGTTPITYQWQKDGTDISNATNNTYTISTVSLSDAGNYTCVATNSCGNDTSDIAILTINAPPSINVVSPIQTRCEEDSVALDLQVTGTKPFTYQWLKTGTYISGATDSIFIMNSVTTGEAGYYSCIVSNTCGTKTSNTILLSINTLPSIITNPVSQIKCEDLNVTFSTIATGTQPITYQWQKDDIDILGATDSIYSINSSALADTGNYTCIVTNVCRSDTSNIAVLIINPLPISDFTINPSVICFNSNTTVTYIGQTDTNVIYNWDFDGGVIDSGSGAGPYLLHWITDGLKNISLTVIKNGCDSVTFHSVTVKPETQPLPICIVGVDSATKKNMVVWEKPITTVIDSFYIYKETSQAGVYEKIGTLPYNAFSTFIDTGSNPSQEANRYKITAFDTCNYEAALSDYHKTNHLTINAGMGGAWNLIWDGYEGFTFASYNIYRGTSDTNLTYLTQIASTLSSYTDLTPPLGTVYYQIEVVNPNGCNPSKKGNNYTSSKSNIVNSDMIGIPEKYINKMINIFPNPTDNNINVVYYGTFVEDVIVDIYNI